MDETGDAAQKAEALDFHVILLKDGVSPADRLCQHRHDS
jgi:nicotinamidase-related amidase